MKLAFSTLGCPSWELATIIEKAAAFGFDGIEVRGVKETLDVTTIPEFTTHVTETRQRFADAGIDIACFSSSVIMTGFNKEDELALLAEVERYAALCDLFGTKCIRIFGGKIGEKSWDQAIDEASANLSKMAEILKNSSSRIVVETHDDWMAGEHFRRVMENVNSSAVGVLWDVNHPYMFIGEKPATTWQEIGPWVYHTHWKDTIPRAEYKHGFAPCLMGEGVVPHAEILKLLRDGNYDAYLSLEWEKRWHAEIADPEIAFPQYFKYMKDLMGSL